MTFCTGRTCLDLLEEFNRENGIVVQEPLNPEQVLGSAGTKTRYQPLQLSRNLDSLKDLLDITRLQRELRKLIEKRMAPKSKAYFTNSDTNTMVSTWTKHNHVHSMLGSYVSVLSDDQCSFTGILLYRLLHSVRVIPGLVSDSEKLSVILKAQRWEMCRSLMMVFNWYRDAGPRTVKCILNIHRTLGHDRLKQQSLLLADFVNHIVWHVYQEQKSWLETKKREISKRRKIGTRGIPLEEDDVQPAEVDVPYSNFGPCPSTLRYLPRDLYGICPTSTRDKPIELPSMRTFKGGLDELYARTSAVIQMIWTDQLIIPSLKPIDTAFSGPRRQTTDNDNILNRCLTRGAILQCIADACGTDAIFASSAISQFLASPSLIFEKQLHRDNVFAQKAINDAVTTLEPLFDWLTDRIKDSPDILKTAEHIGDLTHLNMLELASGRPILLERTCSDKSSTILEAATGFSMKREQQKRKQIFSEVSLRSLVPDQATVGVGVMGLIVREALAARRKLATTDEVLHRVLQGRHATRNAASSHNPDHTDPIRQYSLGAQLLYHHLPGKKLTTEMGLSNLLSWLGTGQGFVTQSFLKTVEPMGFYAENVTAMVNQFQHAVSTNWYHIEQRNHSDPSSVSGSGSKSQSTKFPEHIVTHDARIWGQPCNHLALFPTHHNGDHRGSKYTLDEKFDPYFMPAIKDQWKKALGDMLHEDPSAYTGSRRSWGYYHRMVKDLNIRGFQQGLTVFQLANYLVFSGIATMPHWSEVADFIADNRQKGAFRGLERLGFNMPDTSSVRAAFYCVHHHLEEYLTEEDKRILGFSVLFTEHLLCKVVRWSKHLDEEGDIDFYQMGVQAESINIDWVAGLNQTDNTAFPFPLTIDSEALERAIRETTVSITIIYLNKSDTHVIE